MRLWELPTFAERGELSAVHDARALTAGSAAGLLVSGDKHGAVKVCLFCGTAAVLAAHALGITCFSLMRPCSSNRSVCGSSLACKYTAQRASDTGGCVQRAQ